MSEAPPHDCRLCPRLAEFLERNRRLFPHFFNGPVPCFGNKDAKLMIVGLAPGLKGANQSGRPFTGDFAGHLLYGTIDKFGLSRGVFRERADDGLELTGVRIVNAVRCVPPENKVMTAEIKACNRFLKSEIEGMPHLKVIITLGTVAHAATLMALGKKPKDFKFAHGALHDAGKYTIANSFHCSKYNTSTRRLTPAMFQDVFARVKELL